MAPLQVPWPDLGPPAQLPPLSASMRVTGNTTRIGNVICAWYFAQLPSFKPLVPAVTVFTPLRSTIHALGTMQCSGDEMCFGRWLLAPKDDGKEDVMTPLASTTMHELSSIRVRVQPIEGVPYAPELWPLYQSDFLALVAEGLARDLAPRMTAYANTYNPRLLAPPPSPTHCVVHYRAGDYADFMRMMMPSEDPSRLPANWSVPVLSVDSVARAVASFVPPPETVEILNGGAFHIDQMQDYNHYTDAASTLSSTESELLSLQRAIERRLPRVKVTIDLDREATVDADFFRAATAPRLVTTLGSFGVAAAAAGLSAEVRSPALSDFFYMAVNFTKASTPPRTFRRGWETYPFDLVWGDGWVGDSLWDHQGSGQPPQQKEDGMALMAAELARAKDAWII